MPEEPNVPPTFERVAPKWQHVAPTFVGVNWLYGSYSEKMSKFPGFFSNVRQQNMTTILKQVGKCNFIQLLGDFVRRQVFRSGHRWGFPCQLAPPTL